MKWLRGRGRKQWFQWTREPESIKVRKEADFLTITVCSGWDSILIKVPHEDAVKFSGWFDRAYPVRRTTSDTKLAPVLSLFSSQRDPG